MLTDIQLCMSMRLDSDHSSAGFLRPPSFHPTHMFPAGLHESLLLVSTAPDLFPAPGGRLVRVLRPKLE